MNDRSDLKMIRTIYWFDLKTEHFYDVALVILIFEQLKDPRDAVILKKGSTVNGLQSLHKGAVVSRHDTSMEKNQST